MTACLMVRRKGEADVTVSSVLLYVVMLFDVTVSSMLLSVVMLFDVTVSSVLLSIVILSDLTVSRMLLSVVMLFDVTVSSMLPSVLSDNISHISILSSVTAVLGRTLQNPTQTHIHALKNPQKHPPLHYKTTHKYRPTH
jgi:hypothetical protein